VATIESAIYPHFVSPYYQEREKVNNTFLPLFERGIEKAISLLSHPFATLALDNGEGKSVPPAPRR
jgi:hypothetical protein